MATFGGVDVGESSEHGEEQLQRLFRPAALLALVCLRAEAGGVAAPAGRAGNLRLPGGFARRVVVPLRRVVPDPIERGEQRLRTIGEARERDDAVSRGNDRSAIPSANELSNHGAGGIEREHAARHREIALVEVEEVRGRSRRRRVGRARRGGGIGRLGRRRGTEGIDRDRIDLFSADRHLEL